MSIAQAIQDYVSMSDKERGEEMYRHWCMIWDAKQAEDRTRFEGQDL